jgi:uncharacterized hydrophobic protein (TIGR00271 family)
MKTYLQRLLNIQEDLNDFAETKKEIENNIRFSGSNLWILITAIFLASIGLNVNSPAVVIGAMLISPLMGPIIGLGIGAALNDVPIIKKSTYNFLFSILFSLGTSTIYFLFTPLNEAYSELLARTTPNIYDVFVAMLGGFAGIIGLSSKNRGNILPGVAIATALMPPMCTSGYGIATQNFTFFFGAIYLFIINSVFIALSAYLFAKFLKFPVTKMKDVSSEKRTARIILFVTLITVAPSIYYGFEMIQKSRFESNSDRFVQNEMVEKGYLVVRKNISYNNKTIEVIILGSEIDSSAINSISQQLINYQLGGSKLLVRNGNFYERNAREIKGPFLREESDQFEKMAALTDSLIENDKLKKEIEKDIEILFPSVAGVYFSATSKNKDQVFIQLQPGKALHSIDTSSINAWISKRLKQDSLAIHYK